MRFLESVTELHGANSSVIVDVLNPGRNFGLEIGNLENTESIELSVLKFSSENLAGVELNELTIDGLNSSVFSIASIGVSSGGDRKSTRLNSSH